MKPRPIVNPIHASLLAAILLPMLAVFPLQAEDWPWTMLIPAHESRDPEMCAFDDADIEDMLGVLNATDKIKHSRFTFSKVPIAHLLDALTPFADLHFDSINPTEFTPAEKSIIEEWIKRGGFLIAFEDTYPYEPEDFRKKRDLPIFDFFTRELPASDPDFTVSKAGPTHPIFQQPFPTRSAPSIEVEMEENPNYRGRTILLYKGRTVVFFMGRYNIMEDGRWVPLLRPFPEEHALAVESYSLTINVYFYALTH